MRRRSANFLAILISFVYLFGCATANSTLQPTPLPSVTATIPPTATQKPTQTPEPSTTPTSTPRPTKTPIPRYPLSIVFPTTSSGQSIWSNADPGAWINIDYAYVIHFDVLAPNENFDRNSCVLSPVEGVVSNVFISGGPGKKEGQVIVIDMNYYPIGIENIFSPDFKNEITYLSHDNEYSFNYNIKNIERVGVSIGHIVVSKNLAKGSPVKIGDCIGTVEFDAWFNQIKIAYVLFIFMKDGTVFQFSPCSVENLDPFCEKCASNSPFRCKSNE